MKTLRAPLFFGVFALGMLALTGCDCNTNSCAPAPRPVVRPLPPPCNPCGPVAVAPVTEVKAVATVCPTPNSGGFCWVSPSDDLVVLPDPPTVTRNGYGQVVASTPTGRLQPPAQELAFGYR